VVTVVEVGGKARRALARTGGTARVLAELSASRYLTANGEIVWLAGPGGPLHPRAALVTTLPEAVDGMVRLDLTRARLWRGATPPRAPEALGRLALGCRALADALGEIGTPEGLGRLLAGAAPAFPLDRAAVAARGLAHACAAHDPEGAEAAALALLGLGPGLTPAGDDFAGAAFFVRARLRAVGAARWPAWAEAAARLARAARARTHPISAALLGDLLEGEGVAPLCELADALADGAGRERAVGLARRLVALGHTSGWDLLAGLVAGAGALE
jgi:hypothetical protein